MRRNYFPACCPKCGAAIRVCTRVACAKDQPELADLNAPRTLESLREYMKKTQTPLKP